MTDSTGHVWLAHMRTLPVTRIIRCGNELRDAFCPGERYVIDFSGLLSEGWQQYDTDQDASYFGVWVCRETRETLTYAEGDWTLVSCPTPEGFIAELASMAEFYGSPPPAFVAYDLVGTVTHYFDERPA